MSKELALSSQSRPISEPGSGRIVSMPSLFLSMPNEWLVRLVYICLLGVSVQEGPRGVPGARGEGGWRAGKR